MSRLSVYFFSVILLLVILFISCSKNDEVNEIIDNKWDEISFSTQVSQTKGTPISNDNFSSFGLFANYSQTDMTSTTPAMFNGYNIFVQRTLIPGQTPGNWNYSPSLKWQNDYKVSFFAYAPYETNPVQGQAQNSVISVPTSGFPTLRFTQSENVPNQKDLIIAQKINTVRDELNPKVYLSMEHMLSQINFYLKLAPEYLPFISAFPTNIQRSLKTTHIQIYFPGNVSKQALYNWQNNTLTAQAVYFTSTGSTSSLKQNITLNPALVDLNKTNANTYQKVNDDDSPLFMIPQNVAANGMKIEFTELEQTSYDMQIGGKSTIAFQRKFTIPFPALEWNRGQKVGYNLQINPSSPSELKTVDWVNSYTLSGKTYVEVNFANQGVTDMAYYPNGPQGGAQGVVVGEVPISAHFLIDLADISGTYNSCPTGWRAPTLKEYQYIFALSDIMNSLNIPGFTRISYNATNTTFIDRIYNSLNSVTGQGQIYTINFFTGANTLIQRNTTNRVRCIKDFPN